MYIKLGFQEYSLSEENIDWHPMFSDTMLF
jgi:hypothetical protein